MVYNSYDVLATHDISIIENISVYEHNIKNIFLNYFLVSVYKAR